MALAGVWELLVEAPMGELRFLVTLHEDGGVVTGESTPLDGGTAVPLQKIKRTGDKVSWSAEITKPMKLKVDFALTLDGDTLSGTASPGFFGKFPVSATRRG